MSSQQTPIAFVDTETTGLDPFIHDAWEFAIIRREASGDTEHVFRVEPSLGLADPKALEINRYHERTSAAGWQWDDRHEAAQALYALLNGAVIVGSNAPFDAEMLTHLFGGYYANPRPWHYRVIDIATLAAGALAGTYGRPISVPEPIDGDLIPVAFPWKSRDLSRAVGVEPPGEDEAHTALADCRWARGVFDAVTRAPELAVGEWAA